MYVMYRHAGKTLIFINYKTAVTKPYLWRYLFKMVHKLTCRTGTQTVRGKGRQFLRSRTAGYAESTKESLVK